MITGSVFGRLTVLHDSGVRKFGSKLWECRCECGETVLARTSALLSGSVKSCGCLRRERMREIGLRNRKGIHLTERGE